MRTTPFHRRGALAACLRLALVLSVLAAVALPLRALRAADPATFTVGPFTFHRPSGWTSVPVNSPMRKAQFHVADPANPAGPGAEVVFYFFGPGQGGGVEENVSRWLAQFSEPREQLKPEIETAEVKGTKITRVRVASGTFDSSMPGTEAAPVTGYGLDGAILDSPQGDVFIKMTGPASAVKSAATEFAALLQSPF